MNFDDWLNDGSIKKVKPSFVQASDLLTSAANDLEAAEQLASFGHNGLSRDTAYGAMLKCGLALMLTNGFRPESGSHHVTVVRFVDRVMGPEFDELTASFDRLRRTRHERLYEGRESASPSGAQHAVMCARQLEGAVRRAVRKSLTP